MHLRVRGAGDGSGRSGIEPKRDHRLPTALVRRHPPDRELGRALQIVAENCPMQHAAHIGIDHGDSLAVSECRYRAGSVGTDAR